MEALQSMLPSGRECRQPSESLGSVRPVCAAAGRGVCSETGFLQSRSVSAPEAPPSSAAEVGGPALTVGAPDHLPQRTAKEIEAERSDHKQLFYGTPRRCPEIRTQKRKEFLTGPEKGVLIKEDF